MGKLGREVISKFIKDNQKIQRQMAKTEEEVYKYYHNKPPLRLNPWKFSNHIIKEFSIYPGDQIHSFRKEKPIKPSYMVEPFRRPKDNGDYFDPHIGIL